MLLDDILQTLQVFHANSFQSRACALTSAGHRISAAQLKSPQPATIIKKVANLRPEACMHESKVELTILMPCLNETETLALCINKAKSFLERAGVSGEVLIADNGSTDGSQQIALALGARVISVRRRGYGAALLGGIHHARGTYVIMGDSDDSYDFSKLDSFLEKLRAGYDLVVGNRFEGGIAPGAMPFLHKYLGNPVLSLIGRVFFRLQLGDFHCGLRGFRTQTFRDLELRTTGMEFASEMIVRAGIMGLQISEVPTSLAVDGRSRPPHLKTWRDGWRHLKFLLIYSPKWLFMMPGACFFLLGMALAITLATGIVKIPGGPALGLNTFIVGCFLSILGTQAIGFGLMARRYGAVMGILPMGPRSRMLQKFATTDNAILAALLLFIFGIGIFSWAVREWASVNFGLLETSLAPRAVIAGFSLIVVAVQTAFQAFIIGLMDIPIVPEPSTDVEYSDSD
jgi:glycosyltransferase involved in cell wall biosynthesis